MTHFFAAFLVDVELAFRARGRVRAATRVDLEILSGKDLGVLYVANGDFGVFVVYYTGIEVNIWLLAPQHKKRNRRLRRLTIFVEFSPSEFYVLDHDCFRTPVNNVDRNIVIPNGFG